MHLKDIISSFSNTQLYTYTCTVTPKETQKNMLDPYKFGITENMYGLRFAVKLMCEKEWMIRHRHILGKRGPVNRITRELEKKSC